MTYAHTLYMVDRRTSLLLKADSDGLPGSFHTLCSVVFFLFRFFSFLLQAAPL